MLDNKEEGANYWEPAVRESSAGIYVFPDDFGFHTNKNQSFWSRLLGSRVAGSEASLFNIFSLFLSAKGICCSFVTF